MAIASITSFRLWDNRDWEYDYHSVGCEAIYGYTAQEITADKTLWISRVFAEDLESCIFPLAEKFFQERNATTE